MSYTPTTWVDGETPVNAQNLNKLERAVKVNSDAVESIVADAVRYDQTQNLTEEQKAQARANIGAMTRVLLWENLAPGSTFAPQTINIDLSQCYAVLIKFVFHNTMLEEVNTWWDFCPVGETTNANFGLIGNNIGTATAGRMLTVTENGIVFGNGGFQQTTSNNMNDPTRAIPLKIYGLSCASDIWNYEDRENLFDINNLLLAGPTSYNISRPPKVENGVFYSGGKTGDGVGAFSYVTVNEGDTIRFSANVTGTGIIKVYAFPTPVDRLIDEQVLVKFEEISINNASVEKTYTIPAGKNCFGFAAEGNERYCLQLTDIVIQKIN